MKVLRNISFIMLLAGAAALMSGCSSGPSADDLAQLDQLKTEVESLKKEIAAKEAEKATLETQVQQKKDELATAENNQKLTRERLNSQQ
jgi:septal ring factor EnvC (AmiA/AmiB activator)